MHCHKGALSRDYHTLGLTPIQFHSLQVTSRTNPTEVRNQGLCATVTRTPGYGTKAIKLSGVISITDQLIFQNVKKLRSVQEEQ